MFSKLKFKLILEETFNVKIISINTYVLAGKVKRIGRFEGFKNRYKRVFVKLVWF